MLKPWSENLQPAEKAHGQPRKALMPLFPLRSCKTFRITNFISAHLSTGNHTNLSLQPVILRLERWEKKRLPRRSSGRAWRDTGGIAKWSRRCSIGFCQIEPVTSAVIHSTLLLNY